MFERAKISRRKWAAMALVSAIPVIFVLLGTHFSNGSTPLESASIHTKASPLKPATGGPSADLDHDGLPDAAELRTFNDRKNFSPVATNPNSLGFYRLKILNQHVTPED